MNYLSVCSGIEAASMAWEPLGWNAVGFSEIEKFPSEVLAHRWPDVPNLGDMTKYREWNIRKSIDLLVGGTPCQAFSVAGLRKGLADPRGNLTLTFLAMVDHFKPSWVVWENVPGVLSDKGNAFGQFLSGLGELGYQYAYRVLDAQHFGVPQRRRRVFVVANLGGVHPAQVLFEPESLCGDITPSREAGESVAAGVGKSLRGGSGGIDREGGHTLICSSSGQAGAVHAVDMAPALDCNRDGAPIISEAHPTAEVIGCLNSAGGNAVPGNTVQDAISHQLIPTVTHTLELHFNASEVVAFAQNSRDELREMPVVGALAAEPGMKQTSYIRQTMAVRRLTPTECERLQGFPDGHTMIPWKGKPAEECADGPRYKALGNSMAVPVMRWIGERIDNTVTAKADIA